MGLIHFIVKYSLFLLNLIITILGVAIVVIGVLLLNNIQLIAEPTVLDGDIDILAAYKLISIGIIVFGCIVFIVAFSGCCGAVTETKCLLVTYAVFMFFLITAKIYLAVVWHRDIGAVRHDMNTFITDIFEDPNGNVTFHALEATLKCCGTTGPDSYELQRLPPTCCPDITNLEDECLLQDALDIGCLELVDNFIAHIGKTVKTVLVWTIVIEMLEFIAAIYLCTSINKRIAKPNYNA